jgi:hypothetical protein
MHNSGNFLIVSLFAFWCTTTSIQSVLASVVGFLQQNSNEVVILHFHQFLSLHHKLDHKRLASLAVSGLGYFLYNNPPTLILPWKKKSGKCPAMSSWNGLVVMARTAPF